MADSQTNADNYGFQMLPADARWDERVLHFLKELPAWLIILFLLAFLVTVWLRTASVQIESYIGQALAALLTAVVTNRQKPQQPTVDNSITADVIKTPQVNTQTMPGAQITVGPGNLDPGVDETKGDL